MRRLYYSGGQMLVSDRTCKAVLRYSRGLALAGKADVISVPVILEGGAEGYAHLLIGPSSEFFSSPVPGAPAGPDNIEVLDDLERRTLGLQPSRPGWAEEMTDVPDLEALGLDYY